MNCVKDVQKPKQLSHADRQSPELQREALRQDALPVLALQRSAGNQAVLRLLASGVLQAKLTVSHPNDSHEQEADRVADEVMRMQEPQVQRQPLEEEEEKLQKKPLTTTITRFVQQQAPKEEEEEPLRAKARNEEVPEVAAETEARIDALQGRGTPLLDSVRSLMESRFKADPSDVRVHVGEEASISAEALNAQAFTIGRDIVSSSGRYAPETKAGRHLLAHELPHLETRGSGNCIHRKGGSQSEEAAWEEEQPEGRVETMENNRWIFWNFAVASSQLKSEFEAGLEAVVKNRAILSLSGLCEMKIEGHTSSSGTERGNKSLSHERARAVRDDLVSRHKVSRFGIFVVPYGESRPWFPNATPSTMARNRRVEVTLYPAEYTPPPEVPQKEPAPPVEKRTEGGAPGVQIADYLPNGEFSFRYPLDPKYGIPVGSYVIIYPSGELRGTFKLKTGRPETIGGLYTDGKLGLVVKEELDKGIRAKVDSAGKIGLEFFDTPLRPEVVFQPLEILKPVSLNVSQSIPISEITVGSGVKMSGEVKLQVNFGVGPGPGMAATFGTTGVVIAGSVAGSILLVYGTARLVGAASERGIAWSGRVATRNCFAWKIAAEAAGGTADYNHAVEEVEMHRSYGNYREAYQGWSLASDSLNRLGARKQEFLKLLKEKTGTADVTSLHDSVFQAIGGIEESDRKPPDDLFDLLR